MSTLVKLDWPTEYIARLRLDRPDVRNAINRAVLADFRRHLDDLATQDVRALLVTGTDDSFSVGADLKQIQSMSPSEAREFSQVGNELFHRIETFSSPVIAAINGYALGGGCELACACDLRYAVSSARLGQPETKMGMIPGWGGTFRLPQIVGRATAKELVLTGMSVDAHEACQMGLVHQAFDEQNFEQRVLEKTTSVASNAPVATREAKRLLSRSLGDQSSHRNEESLALAYCVSTEDQSEALRAFFENREPTFTNQ